jgi:flagellin
MGVTFNASTSANVSILKSINENFQTAQKRVSTGKAVFSAADDATRFKMSETMLGRSRQIETVNNNIALGLKTLEATDKTLGQVIGLVESAQSLVRKAQAEGAGNLRSVTAAGNVNSSTSSASSIGSRFSITTDDGKNFTYTASAANVSWGTIADALNSANIGVVAEFVPSTVAGQTNLRFKSTSGKDFTFDAISDQAMVNSLGAITSPTGQTFTANNLFGSNTGAVTGGETGFTIGYGGRAVGAKTGLTAATAVAAGSTLVFEDGNGQTRTLNYTAATTLATVLSDINNMNAGVKAELVNNGAAANATSNALRLRNTNGGDMKILSATGDFAATGTLGLSATTGFAAPLSSNNAIRLAYGVQYDAIIANINQQIANNPVQAGRNLLQGQNLAVSLDEFSGTPVTVAGINITAAGTLTMAQAGSTWTSDANIQTSATQANQALLNLRDYQSQFATFNSYMKSRFDLNASYAKDLKTAGDDLVSADVAEESANLSALQTQQSFAVQAFSLASQNSQGLLRLLG